MKMLLAMLAILFCVASCSTINKKLGLKDDNLGEEIVETIIQKELGPNIDLTPETPEK